GERGPSRGRRTPHSRSGADTAAVRQHRDAAFAVQALGGLVDDAGLTSEVFRYLGDGQAVAVGYDGEGGDLDGSEGRDHAFLRSAGSWSPGSLRPSRYAATIWACCGDLAAIWRWSQA